MSTRIARLIARHGWSQHRMAEYLGVSQPTVARMVAGQDESGAIARLLDILEHNPALALADVGGDSPQIGSDGEETREGALS